MRKFIILSLAVLTASGLAAQQRDSVRQRSDTADTERLRARVEQRFSERVQENLNLTPEQTTKLRASQEKFSSRRRTLMEQQRDRRRALEDQMQPGVAANADSVNKLLDGLQAGRAEMLKLEQDQDDEMSRYLTPVQRARYQQMRDNFMERVRDMRLQRRGQMDGGRGRHPAPGAGGRRRGI